MRGDRLTHDGSTGYGKWKGGGTAEEFTPLQEGNREAKLWKNLQSGMTVVAENLSYAAPRVKRGEAPPVLLRDVTVLFRPNECYAVMGSSGSGKSTLLEVMSNRRRGGTAQGRVLFDGVALSQHRAGCCSFVQQDCESVLDGGLTALETLEFAADLRGVGTNSAARRAVVAEVVDALELSRCASTRCQMLSGGECRRVTIGEELVGSPSVLLLDEPTTGLDSFAALAVIRMLTRLARQGVTVAFSLHQPPYAVFEPCGQPQAAVKPLLEKVVLLWAGRVAYQGPAQSALPFLCEQSGAPLDAGANVADAWVSCLRCDETAQSCCEAFEGSELFRLRETAIAFANSRTIATAPVVASPLATDEEEELDECCEAARLAKCRAGCALLRRVFVATKRYAVSLSRRRSMLAVFFAQHVAIGLLYGLVNINPPRDQTGTTNVERAIFFVIVFAAIGMSPPLVPLFCRNVTRVRRERVAGALSPAEHSCASFLVHGLLAAMLLVPLLVPVLYLADLRVGKGAFFAAYAGGLVVELGGLATIELICTAVQLPALALALFSAIAQLTILVTGLALPLGDFPEVPLNELSWFNLGPALRRWVCACAYSRWGYEAWMIAQFDDGYAGVEGSKILAVFGFEHVSVFRALFNAAVCVLVTRALCVLALTNATGYSVLWLTPEDGRTVFQEKYLPDDDDKKRDREQLGVQSADAKSDVVSSKSFNNEGLLERPRRNDQQPLAVEEEEQSSRLLGDCEGEDEDARPQPGLEIVVSELEFGAVNDGDALLDKCSARFVAGESTAIMGASGAGKSTLLRAVAGELKATPGATEWRGNGLVAFAGESYAMPGQQPKAPPEGSIALAEQSYDELLWPFLTVSETLLCAAELRSSSSSASWGASPAAIAKSRARSVARRLLLAHRLTANVATLSGGERRRVALALELVGTPKVLLCDEPTSGLASDQAILICEMLRQVARDFGTTVVSVIHTPPSSAFFLFDKLLLMDRGCSVFEGPPSEVFTALQLDADSPLVTADPSSAAINGLRLLAPEQRFNLIAEKRVAASHARVSRLFAMPREFGSMLNNLCASTAQSGADDEEERARLLSQFQQEPQNTPPFSLVLKAVVRRKFQKTSRNTRFLAILVVRTVLMGVIFGGFFAGPVQREKKARASLLYFSLAFLVFSSVQEIAVMFSERVLFEKERKLFGDQGKLNYVLSYWTATALVTVPLKILQACLFSGMLVVTAGIWTKPDKYFALSFILCIVLICGAWCVQLLASCFSFIEQASIAYTFVSAYLALFSGYNVLLTSLPVIGKVASYLSFVRWALQCEFIILFEDNYLISNDLSGVPQDGAFTQESILKIYSFDQQTYAQALACLIASALLILLATLPVLYFREWTKVIG